MNNRKLHIDALRILAISLVVYNHTALFNLAFADKDSQLGQCIGYICSEICKMGVPLFFMISGALLLKREESIRTILTRRVLPFSTFFVLFCILQLLYGYVRFGDALTVTSIAIHIFCGSCYAPASWFMFAYIGLLLMLPFTRSMIRGLEKKHFLYLISLQLIICGFVPSVLFLFSPSEAPVMSSLHQYFPFAFNDRTAFPFAGMQYLYFMLIGYFSECMINSQGFSKKHWGLLISSVIVCLVFGSVMMLIHESRTDNFNQITPFLTSFLTIPLIVLYIGTKHLLSKVSTVSLFSKLVVSMGAATIVVFALENILRDFFGALLNRTTSLFAFDKTPMYVIISNIFLILFVVVTGCCIGIIAKKIPGLKWVLGDRGKKVSS